VNFTLTLPCTSLDRSTVHYGRRPAYKQTFPRRDGYNPAMSGASCSLPVLGVKFVLTVGKGKRNGNPRTGHEGPQGIEV
jgi:hypothetical protein